MRVLAVAGSPTPALATTARDARDYQRAQKRSRGLLWRARRVIMGALATVFITLGMGGGTAQAWPWDVQENVTAFISNVCKPENVPQPTGHQGIDNNLGLNNAENVSDIQRGTVVPPIGNAGGKGPGITRLQSSYGALPAGELSAVARPTYERYGFATLKWSNYGADCFSMGFIFSQFNDIALRFLVIFPLMAGMAVLHLAMDNTLYAAWGAVFSIPIQYFAQIFTPWGYWVAPFGVLWVFFQSRGSLVKTLKAAIWVLAMVGALAWMTNNTAKLVSTMNNAITGFTSSSVATISDAEGGGGAVVTGSDPIAAIDQSLWHGLAYQTWLTGMVGPEQAERDRVSEDAGDVGWGAAILNGNYVSVDDEGTLDAKGTDVVKSVNKWNGLSYAPTGDETKTDAWTEENIYNAVPFLAHVGMMCNDPLTTGGGGSEKENVNRWFYGGSCDAAGAGTTQMVPHFTGSAYNEQFITAITGGISIAAVQLTISIMSFYLAIQKTIFMFFLLWAPLFLTIAMFADDKRRKFATVYAEKLGANMLKQCAAVLAVLFTANAVSNLVYPPESLNLDIPWALKPFAIIILLASLILFAIPLTNILKAAVRGDSSVVGKAYNAPKRTATTGAKVLGVTAALAATGGVAGAVGVGAGGTGAIAKGLTSAGRAAAASGHTGVGKNLRGLGSALRARDTLAGAKVVGDADKAARKAGVAQMLEGDSGKEYVAGLKKTPGLVGKDGILTAAGQKHAERDFKSTAALGAKASQADAAQKKAMESWYAGEHAKNGVHHANDPKNPVNIEAKRVADTAEKQRIAAQAKQASAAEGVDGAGKGAPKATPTGGPVGAAAAAAAAAAKPAVDPDGKPVLGADGKPLTVGEVDAAKMGTTQAEFADKARSKLDAPAYARKDIKSEIEQSPAQVLAAMNTTQAQAVANPAELLAKGYAGGDTSKMDPANPATAEMTKLRFAIANGSQEEVASAAKTASDAIAKNGVPSMVASTGSTGKTGEAFRAIDAIAPMPSVTAATTPSERAAAATTMQAAASLIPVGDPATGAVQQYVSALSNPTVNPEKLDGLKSQAIQALEVSEASRSEPGVNTSGGGASFVPVTPRGGAGVNEPVMAGAVAAPAGTAGATLSNDAVREQAVANGMSPTSAPVEKAIDLNDTVGSLPSGHPAHSAMASYTALATDPSADPAAVSAAHQATITAAQAVEVNDVALTAASGYGQIATAVEGFSDPKHPSKAALSNFEDALDSPSTSQADLASARETVMSAVGAGSLVNAGGTVSAPAGDSGAMSGAGPSAAPGAPPFAAEGGLAAPAAEGIGGQSEVAPSMGASAPSAGVAAPLPNSPEQVVPSSNGVAAGPTGPQASAVSSGPADRADSFAVASEVTSAPEMSSRSEGSTRADMSSVAAPQEVVAEDSAQTASVTESASRAHSEQRVEAAPEPVGVSSGPVRDRPGPGQNGVSEDAAAGAWNDAPVEPQTSVPVSEPASVASSAFDRSEPPTVVPAQEQRATVQPLSAPLGSAADGERVQVDAFSDGAPAPHTATAGAAEDNAHFGESSVEMGQPETREQVFDGPPARNPDDVLSAAAYVDKPRGQDEGQSSSQVAHEGPSFGSSSDDVPRSEPEPVVVREEPDSQHEGTPIHAKLDPEELRAVLREMRTDNPPAEAPQVTAWADREPQVISGAGQDNFSPAGAPAPSPRGETRVKNAAEVEQEQAEEEAGQISGMPNGAAARKYWTRRPSDEDEGATSSWRKPKDQEGGKG